jgi:branched-chain amino acid transport system permease protein
MELFVQATVNGVVTAGLYALIAYGVLILLGIMNIVNFAHGEFVMLGAYLTYWIFITTGIDPLLIALPAAALVFLLALPIYKFAVRPVLNEPPVNQLALTYGISLTLQSLALILWKADLRSIDIPYANVSVNFGFVDVGLVRLSAFVVACVAIGLLQFITYYTRIGKALQAVSQNKTASALVGIDVNFVHLMTFGAAAAVAGIAGSVVSVLMYTYPFVGVPLVLKAFAIVIVGGLGSVSGTILASLVLALAESYVGTFVPNGSGWSVGVTFVLIIFALVVRPQGMFGVRDHG